MVQKFVDDQPIYDLVWIYLPLPPQDRAVALGIQEVLRGRFNILVRTELMGDIMVGLQPKGDGKARCLAASAPVTIIYGERKEGFPMRFFGSYSRLPVSQSLIEPFRLEYPGPCPIDGNNVYFSWAPLCGVASTLVFYDEYTRYCYGILFHYQNGGSRAVGECRLHVDPAERVDRPARLCFKAIPLYVPHRRDPIYRKTQVKFKQDDQTSGTENGMEGWEIRPMQGILKFWFTTVSSALVVES